jgi:predicted RNA binding protein YcfA (HicA-like mRNA interferase family)
VKVRAVIAQIERDGWYMLPRRGTGHRQFKHPTKAGRVTIAGQLSDDVPPGTLASILKQAGLKEQQR